jgi:membrane fusion protein (multidrug efflux system)
VSRPRPRALLGALLALGLACGRGGAPPQPPPAEVGVATAQLGRVPDRREYVGTLRAVNRVEVRARVRGYLLEQLYEDGALVAEGDPLFRIDPSPYEVAVAEARGQLARARATAQRAERDYARARELFEQRVLSDAVLDQRHADRDAGAAEVQAAEAAVQAAELDLAWCTVRAPLAGRTGRALVDVGNLVGESGQDTVLAEIVQVDPIYVYFAPTEAERLEVAQGAGADRAIPVQLVLGDGTDYPQRGVVDYVDPTVDATRGTVTVRARVPNPGGELRPGAFVRVVAVFPDRTEAVLVPQRAVLDEQGGRYVLVVKEDDTVEHRRVTAGVVHDGLQQVTQGLAAGERVIADGVQKARPGAKVAPKPLASPS